MTIPRKNIRLKNSHRIGMHEYIIGIFLVSFIALAVFLPILNFAYAFAISEQQRQPHITASNIFQHRE
jgi:hypothetical protein